MSTVRGPSSIRLYFSVPSTAGFSPYRTGAGLHLALSTVEGGAAYAAATLLAGWPWWAGVAAALAAVVALWGVGWMLGVASHYSFLAAPQLAMAGLAVALAVLGKPAVVPALIGLGAHLLAWWVLKALTPR